MKITPALKGLSSSGPDVDNDGHPINPHDCLIEINASIGDKSSLAGDLFKFYVATTSRVISEIKSYGSFICPYVIIIDEFSWDKVTRAIDGILSMEKMNECESWDELADRLSIYGEWEFKSPEIEDKLF